MLKPTMIEERAIILKSSNFQILKLLTLPRKSNQIEQEDKGWNCQLPEYASTYLWIEAGAYRVDDRISGGTPFKIGGYAEEGDN